MAFVLDLADDESRLERWNSSGDGFDRTLQGVPGGLAITLSGVVVPAEPHGNRVRWLYRDGTSVTEANRVFVTGRQEPVGFAALVAWRPRGTGL